MLPSTVSLSVAIIDAATGEAIPGFAHTDCTILTGNGVRQLLQCAGAGPNGDLAGLAAQGKSVRLDFALVHCTLYAWALSVD